MRVVLMALWVGGLLGCGGVEMAPEEDAAARSTPAETQRVEQAAAVACSSHLQCTQYGQQYCFGDPGFCWHGSCICP